jgi:hypothetical protein
MVLTGGSTVSLSGGLSALLSTDCGFCLPMPDSPNFPDFADYVSNLDVSHTENFYIDVLTPGFTLVADSGHDYSSPAISAPEPGTAGMFGTAIAAWLTLSVFCRRRIFATSQLLESVDESLDRRLWASASAATRNRPLP